MQKLPLTAENYHQATDYIGKSGLDCVARSPAHYWAKYLDPDRPQDDEQTAAQLFGSLVHCLVLEPHKFTRRYELIPPDMNKRTAAWTAFKGAHQHKTLIEGDMHAQALRIAEAVRTHPEAGRLLNLADGIAETPMWATDPETGVLVKTKPDFYNTKLQFIVDIKTTNDARGEQFGRDIYKYRYHAQDAFYTDVAAWAGTPVRGFAFIAVEKEPPYEVAVYVLDDDSRELGRTTYREALNTYARCLKSGIWHGYPPKAQTLTLPAWAFK